MAVETYEPTSLVELGTLHVSLSLESDCPKAVFIEIGITYSH